MRKIILTLVVGTAIVIGGVGTASASNFKAPHSSNFAQHDSNFKASNF